MRGATRCSIILSAGDSDFNPRSSCEERPRQAAMGGGNNIISIHAPHARSDQSTTRHMQATTDFNPRSSCEERRGTLFRWHDGDENFNPRSSCEERRSERLYLQDGAKDFNPRSSCEERLIPLDGTVAMFCISIHAPHARSDCCCGRTMTASSNFNPRSSCEERRVAGRRKYPVHLVFQSTLLMRGATRVRLSRWSAKS